MSYDPTIGRFISQDPIAFGGMDPDLYRYVGNDPLNSLDSTGLVAELLRIGAPGAPTIGDIVDDPTVKKQLEWFRRRSGGDADGGQKEEGGWVLYNTCTKEYTLTTDGTHQGSRYRLYRDGLPTIITPKYKEGTPPDPSTGPAPGFPDDGSTPTISACWFVVAAWHTHPGNGKLTDPSEDYPRGDYGPYLDHNIPIIVQFGVGSPPTTFPPREKKKR